MRSTWIVLVMLSAGWAHSAEPTAGRILAHLEDTAVRESSGLAVGRRAAKQQVFWTHNDSGGEARLFAFNPKGQSLGRVQIKGAKNEDWEDLASYVIDEEPRLLIGDIGDNARQRPFLTLYEIVEPSIKKSMRNKTMSANVHRRILFRFPDGAHDCEALAVDTQSNIILLGTKQATLRCKIYSIPLADKKIAVATLIAELPIPMVTAMDISPDGRYAVLLTYLNAYSYSRRPDESWTRAFKRKPRILAIPALPQCEAIAYDRTAQSIYVTSETVGSLKSCPLARLSDE